MLSDLMVGQIKDMQDWDDLKNNKFRTVSEKFDLKVGSFLAQPGIFTTFPFWTADFPNRKVVIILYLQVPCK